MSRILSVLIAASLILGSTAHASESASCNTEQVARMARLYRMQADDMKAITSSFKELYDQASRDQRLSLGVAISSMTLLTQCH